MQLAQQQGTTYFIPFFLNIKRIVAARDSLQNDLLRMIFGFSLIDLLLLVIGSVSGLLS